MSLKVTGIQCPNCKDIIYSRAHHDYHHCSCGDCSVDGGFEYLRYGWAKDRPDEVEISLNVTKKDLYDDWNYRINEFGLITGTVALASKVWFNKN